MEFEGRIKNVMPARTGTSQRGNEWKTLPFVFEYKEVETDPYPDSVVLETFDTNIINGIESCCKRDNDGNLIVEKGELVMTRDIWVRIGFRHKTHLYVPHGGTPRYITDLRINNIMAINAPAQHPQFGQQVAQQQMAQQQPAYQYQPQQQEVTNDNLPF
jgi:hypothetical protein